MIPAPPKTTELTVTRLIAAPPDEVYDVWIDPQSPGGPWFGPGRLIIDVKLDGLFNRIVEAGGRTFPHYGRFTVLDRPRKVEHTWMSEATRGLDTIVSTTFERDGDRTRVTLTHTGVPDDELGRQHAEGWTWVLSMLDERFSRR